MRCKDREISDKQEILSILSRCTTLRLGLTGEKSAYVVPVSFGFETRQDTLYIYFHCAPEGYKTELLAKQPALCFEGDIFLGYEKTARGVTARYESVIGFGRCEFVSGEQELVQGLRRIAEHCGFADYPPERCAELRHVCLGRIVVESISGKRNLPGEQTTADKMKE